MTSEISVVSKFISNHDQSLIEHSTPNGTLPNRLLSPITENSAEMLSTSIQLNKTSSDTTQKSFNIVLKTNASTTDEHYQTLLQRYSQCTTYCQHIQNYLNKLDEHLSALSFIIEYLRNNKHLIDTIEFLETRFIQIRVKRNQIDHLLNQSSTKNLLKQISSMIIKRKSNIDSNEFINSLQLSLNQKTILIDHLTNEYRTRKYQLNEYALKFNHQQELLKKLTKKVEDYLSQHDKLIKHHHHRSITNQHNRQTIEFFQLSKEYEQLKNENDSLILKTKENIQKFSLLIQSN